MARLAGYALVLAALVSAPACGARTAQKESAQQLSPPAAVQEAPREVAPMPSLAPVVQRVLPAIVNISVQRTISINDHPLLSDPEFRREFDIPDDLPDQELEAVGSGIVMDARAGLILTNNHVIEDAEKVLVTLSDGAALRTLRVLTDPGTDLAVIEVEVPRGVQLQELTWGDPNQLLPGDYVVAIGSPFGLEQSVSAGVVSALGRSNLGLQGYENFIQTDAPVNPGSSGGALVNLRGELIGINNVILSPGGGNIGISFAIPSDMAQIVMGQLLENGEVRRGHLGATVRDLTPALTITRNTGVERGVLVVEVEPESPAAEVGLRRGDIITALDGEPVAQAGPLRNHIAFEAVGRELELTVHRDGRQFVLSPTVEPQFDASLMESEHAAFQNQSAVPW